jgi:hypothetical protein
VHFAVLLRNKMDVEWLIHNLCFDEEFDIADIDIDLHDDDEWARLVASLARNNSVTNLKLTRTPEFEMRSTNDMETLFASICMMPHLEQVEMRDFSVLDLECGCEALSGNGTIVKLILDIPDEESLSIDSARALGSIRRLRHMDITVASSWPLSCICDSPSLEEITIDSYVEVNFDDSHVAPLMKILENTSTLRKLDVHDITISGDQVQLIATMLIENTSLETLHLSICIDEEVMDRSCQVIIRAMKSNKSLQHFHNYQHSEVHVTNITQAYQIVMLQRNTTLVGFSLFNDEDSEMRSEKQMYLRLNLGGRKHLLQTAMGSRRAWVDALMVFRNDVICLHYVLLMNPSLCMRNDNQNDDDHCISRSKRARICPVD